MTKYLKYYQQLSPKQVEHLRKWFESVDKDKNGVIDANELGNMIMPGSGNFAGRKIGNLAANSLIKLFDHNNSGTISLLIGYLQTLWRKIDKIIIRFRRIRFIASFLGAVA